MNRVKSNKKRVKKPTRRATKRVSKNPINRGPNHYFGISATFRNEKPYLKEWVDFHLKIGAEVILLFDDRSEDNPLEVLQPYVNSKKVIYHKANKYKQRFPHIRQVIAKYKKLCRWFAFIDIDEFLHPTQNENIVDILKEFDKEGIQAVYVNWLCYGNSWKNKMGKGPVTRRFTRRAEKMFGLNAEVKSIIQPQVVKNLQNSHIFNLKDGVEYYNDRKEKGQLGRITKSYHDNFRKNIRPYYRIYGKKVNKKSLPKMNNKQYPPSYFRLCINHYITRSREEFLDKARRYDLERQDRYSLTVFNKLNEFLNKVDDPHILRLLS